MVAIVGAVPYFVLYRTRQRAKRRGASGFIAAYLMTIFARYKKAG